MNCSLFWGRGLIGYGQVPTNVLNNTVKELNKWTESLRKEFSAPKWLYSSNGYFYDKDEQFIKLAKIKAEEIVPLLLKEKRTANNIISERHFSMGIATLLNFVCKLDGWPDYDPWCGEPLRTTWYGGRELAKERFNLLYGLLLEARKNKDEEKIEMINEAYRSKGIFMLTFLMEKIIDGDEQLLPVVQKMFNQYNNQYGDEIKGKSKDEIIQWWNQNKTHYTVPPQNKEKYDNMPSLFFDLPKDHPMDKKVDLLYYGTIGWRGRNIVQGTDPTQVRSSRKSIALAKLIGYENTPQFTFLVDLGKEALPYLFLKLREEEGRFTLPIIEKIMGKKLSAEEVELHIKEAEKLLPPSSPDKYQPTTIKSKTEANNVIPNSPDNYQPITTKSKTEANNVIPNSPDNYQPPAIKSKPDTNNYQPTTTKSKTETNNVIPKEPPTTNKTPEKSLTDTPVSVSKNNPPKEKPPIYVELDFRIWESRDGLFKTSARFIALIKGKVKLERARDSGTGKYIMVDTEILRQIDLDAIDAIRRRYKEIVEEGKADKLPPTMIFDPL
ncbi:MAG: hypothetical protein LBJ00_08065 [Planctomycetaceae bacterium]|nr:hypothetical protein [Planctomycetaceae bacterium]